MITNPMLPPKTGYVEVEIDGKRTYKNTRTGILIGNEVPEPTEMELAQQAITDLELNDIEQGQAITDLELQLLEVQTNV